MMSVITDYAQNVSQKGVLSQIAWFRQLRLRENIVFMARAIKNNGPSIQRVPKRQKRPYTRWEGTALWRAVDKAVCDLVQNQDLVEGEYHEYVVGYICKIIDRRKRVVIAQLLNERKRPDFVN